jgi:hypothetical protein
MPKVLQPDDPSCLRRMRLKGCGWLLSIDRMLRRLNEGGEDNEID